MTRKYDNHEAEWREEDNREQIDRQRERRQRWIHPSDPDYIATETEEANDAE